MINPGYFRHPRRDWVMCAFWGPLTNILLALLFAGVVRLLVAFRWGLDSVFLDFALIMVLANLGLALFNLLPIHPLDGSKVLSGILPDVFDRRYWSFQMTVWTDPVSGAGGVCARFDRGARASRLDGIGTGV
jgi:Zn-dependent protease